MNKIILAFIAINFSFSFISFDKGTEENYGLAIEQPETSIFEKSFSSVIFQAKCEKEKEEVIASLNNIIKIVQTGQMNKLIPELINLKIKTGALIKCARGGFSSESIDPQCVIEHLNNAGKKLKEIISDIMGKKWADIPKKWTEFIEILEDVKNC